VSHNGPSVNLGAPNTTLIGPIVREGISTIDIRVVATGNSTTAYDEIEIFVGSID
jgi:hypothetical protein